MQFSKILATIILTATSAIANPVAVPEAEPALDPKEQPAALEARAPTVMIDMWENAGFLGAKYTGPAVEPGACVSLATSGFNDRLSSGKARAGFRCTIWNDINCVPNPGFSFNSAGSNFPSANNDKASSWKCVVG